MKAKIYTKGGDKGKTSLVGGTRLLKSDQRIDLYGDLDELNSFIGPILVLHEELAKQDCGILLALQNTLFDLGALMACEVQKRAEFSLNTISSEFITEIEEAIDIVDQQLSPLKEFVMPRGSELATRLHIARTITRRVERKLVGFETSYPDEVIENGVVLLNRLSDYLFVLARLANMKGGHDEIKWDHN